MRHRLPGLLVALVLLPSGTALAHEGNPDFRSEIRAIEPATPGLSVEVLDFDDSLRLLNRSDGVVVIRGYDGEPYARIDSDGTVELNRRSPAYYLNQDRFANVQVPPSANADAAPQWEQVDRSGALTWHDHRAHYMGEGTPPQVKDEGEETKVFDYLVPIEVDGRPGAIQGTLTWVGEDTSFPIAPFIGLALVAALGLAVLLIRRRRGAQSEEAKEAW
jgi:hypothetical protein